MTAAFTQDNNRSAVFSEGAIPVQIPLADRGLARLIADLARVSLTGELAPTPLPILSENSAERLAALAVRTRMTGACARAYALAEVTPPGPLAAAIAITRARAAVSNGRVLGLARMAVPVLAAAGIAGTAFKGPFQHRRIHGDAYFCRSGDFDLLVARADFNAALAAFEAAGFRLRAGTNTWWTRALGEVHLVHPDGGVIDLHHRLQQPGCPPPRDLAAFLRAAESDAIGGVAVPAPDLAHSVLIAALNCAKEFAHRKASARYAYDVAAGLKRLAETGEGERLVRIAADQRLTGTLGFVAAFAARLFACSLPMPAGLAPRALPGWATREALLGMAFGPDNVETRWPRRSAVLWALCSRSGMPGGRIAEFVREQARMLASEGLRRAAGRSSAGA